MNITLKNFAVDLSAYQKMSNYVTPPPASTFYANIIYNAKDNTFTYAIKDIQTFYSFPIEGVIEGEGESFGIKLDPSTLFYIFDNYSADVVKTLEMFFSQEEGKPIVVSVVSPSDSIMLPCSNIDSDDFDDIMDMVKKNVPNTEDSVLISNKYNTDILRGINESLNFVGQDDAVHNAVALFSDRITYNDKRHIFIYSLDEASFVEDLDDEKALALHKKSAKIVDYLYQKGLEFSVYVSCKGDFTWIVYLNSVMKLSNSLSNIAPVPKRIFENISPSNKIAEISLASLLETSTFFTGFFSKGDEWKPLSMEIKDNTIVFELKNSASFSSSCNVTRNFTFKADPSCDLSIASKPFTIINDSLLTFLRTYKGKQDATVSLYSDNSKGGILLEYNNKRVLLAKLNNSTGKK